MKLLEALVDAAQKVGETSGVTKLRNDVRDALAEFATTIHELCAIAQLHSVALQQLYETQRIIVAKLKENSIDVEQSTVSKNDAAKLN